MRLSLAVTLLLLPLAARAECPSAPACNEAGSRHLAAGRFEAAVEDFGSQASWADEKGDRAARVLAYNNLALAELKRGRPLMARAWVRTALRTEPGQKAATFNQGLVDKALAARVPPRALTGTWRSYVGAGEWNVLEVDDVGGGRLHIGLVALRLGMNWRENGPAAMGGLNEVLSQAGGRVRYEAEDCALTIRFHGDEAEVAQEGGCGFGMGVDASGTYLRTDDARPSMEAP